MRKIAIALLLVLAAMTPPAAGSSAPELREGAEHAVPLYGQLLRPYDAPEDPYAPGHRGVDVAAPEGSAVHVSADGVVAFAGNVAGNRTVSVDHPDGVRTTYSYLGSINVVRGQSVVRGHVVGTVGVGHPGSNQPPHVHLSARRDDVYFDPVPLYVGATYADLVVLVA